MTYIAVEFIAVAVIFSGGLEGATRREKQIMKSTY